ncbi:hypothetical protein GGQ87_001825 [Brevundimonas alba]|uniref:Uncharacterized protein n=1 Tax=Brevundimonas alba TaxID=74314 RepID=A0A7X5YKZ0_9CAUL|nr:hypothetical protein [Brevundimonas alba]NJC41567.1 hypothetical protein [Brevundimonas alba]
MKRGLKLAIALFIMVSCVIFAAALAGGLMDDSAFTTAAQQQGH